MNENCENCYQLCIEKYGSGRFCSSKCARGFSTKAKRKEINQKVSNTLKALRPKIFENRICEHCLSTFTCHSKSCSKFCSVKCSANTPQAKIQRSKIATIRTIDGKNFLKSIKCNFSFREKLIRCDSKIEYACLHWFQQNFRIQNISRFTNFIEYELENQTKRFVPDFKIETTTRTFIVECKSLTTQNKTMNEKWRNYIQQIPLKKKALAKFCLENRFEYFWFTVNLHSKFYSSFKPTKI